MQTKMVMQERQREILCAAYELFGEKGIGPVTIADIARRSGVGAATIYRYYGSKQALLLETQKLIWENICEEIRAATVGRPGYAHRSGLGQMEALLSGFARLYRRHEDYLSFAAGLKYYMLEEKLRIPPEEYGDRMDVIAQMFQAAIRKGQQDGSIRRREDPAALYDALWGLMRGYVEQAVLFDRICGVENPYRQSYSLVSGMILELLRGRTGETRRSADETVQII